MHWVGAHVFGLRISRLSRFLRTCLSVCPASLLLGPAAWGLAWAEGLMRPSRASRSSQAWILGIGEVRGPISFQRGICGTRSCVELQGGSLVHMARICLHLFRPETERWVNWHVARGQGPTDLLLGLHSRLCRCDECGAASSRLASRPACSVVRRCLR